MCYCRIIQCDLSGLNYWSRMLSWNIWNCRSCLYSIFLIKNSKLLPDVFISFIRELVLVNDVFDCHDAQMFWWHPWRLQIFLLRKTLCLIDNRQCEHCLLSMRQKVFSKKTPFYNWKTPFSKITPFYNCPKMCLMCWKKMANCVGLNFEYSFIESLFYSFYGCSGSWKKCVHEYSMDATFRDSHQPWDNLVYPPSGMFLEGGNKPTCETSHRV